MKFKLAIVLSLLCAWSTVGAQHSVVLQGGNAAFELAYVGQRELRVSFKLAQLDININNDGFCELLAPNSWPYGVVGQPALPRFARAIELPVLGGVHVEVLACDTQRVDLSKFGTKVKPFAASLSKLKSTNELFYDSLAYQQDIWFYDSLLCRVRQSGFIRNTALGSLQLYPFRYNAAKDELLVFNNLQLRLVFDDEVLAANRPVNRQVAPFRQLEDKLVGYHSISISKKASVVVGGYPEKYVIVSHPMFRAALQDFVAWKTQQGYRVIEAYTDDPLVGDTTVAIKAYLQGLYNAATETDPAPSYVLLVGDHNLLPAWDASYTRADHVTDLYYFTYDGAGDYLPDVYYGRFSAQTVAELRAQLDKSMSYERFELNHTAYLNDVLLVAGVDPYKAQTHANGAVRYAADVYFNAANGYDAHSFLYPESGGQRNRILERFSSGNALVSYSAHCVASGWQDPSFSVDDTEGLYNDGKYSLVIGNCCFSGMFDGDCFAEALMRLPNRGAVAYIGATGFSYWDEDYYWMVGAGAISASPSYAASGLGVLDRLLHEHDEPFTDWIEKTGEMVFAGNLTVSESGSGYEQLYWEIYQLFGDPALRPWLKEPIGMDIILPEPAKIGQSQLSVLAPAGAYVGLSLNGQLLGGAYTNDSGEALLLMDPLEVPGLATLTVCAQGRRPFVGALEIQEPQAAFVLLQDLYGNRENQLHYNAEQPLHVVLKNLGAVAANKLQVQLSSANNTVFLVDDVQYLAVLEAGGSKLSSDAFTVAVADGVADGAVLDFELTVTDEKGSVWAKPFSFMVHAPVLEPRSIYVDDYELGNGNGVLDAGETATLVVSVANTGHAAAGQLSADLALSGMVELIGDATAVLDSLQAGLSASLSFTIRALDEAVTGGEFAVQAKLAAGSLGAYAKRMETTLLIGIVPEYTMGNGELNTCAAYFYDSGGASGKYSNYENRVMTIFPEDTAARLMVDFLAFQLEASPTCSYDWLSVYGGDGVDAPLLGKFCQDGSPGIIVASEKGQALTFRFHSDESTQKDGWVAKVSCAQDISLGMHTVADTVCLGSGLQVSSRSTGYISAYEWDFGVSASPRYAAGAGPHEVRFLNTGKQDIKLKAYNMLGDTAVRVFTEAVFVKDKPAEPQLLVGDTAVCVGGASPVFSALGDSLVWLSGFDRSVLAIGASYEPDVSIAGNYAFEVSQTVDGCLGDGAKVALAVVETEPPLVLNDSLCAGPNIVADVLGADLQWYVGVDSLVFSGVHFVPDYSGLFEVTQHLNGCESVPASVYVRRSDLEVPVFAAKGDGLTVFVSLDVDSLFDYAVDYGAPSGFVPFYDQHTYTEAGHYIIKIKKEVRETGCYTVGVSSVGISSLGELAKGSGIKLYPNPTTGLLYVSLPQNGHCLVNVVVFDVVGHQVFRGDVPVDGRGRASLELGGLRAGVYQLIARGTGSAVYSGRFVVSGL